MAPYINGDNTCISEDFLVNISNGHAKAETARYFHRIDLLLRVQPLHTADGEEGPPPESATGTAPEMLVRRACPDQEVTTKIILAPVDGYLFRTDILDLQMQHSECVDTVVSFPAANQGGACGQPTLVQQQQASSPGFLDAAEPLGIVITILDREGHWLQEQKYAHLWDDSIAIDLSHDV
ncbi:hypothetical protein BDW68DRAFT_183602 [Aspergillus falconensis]